MKPLPALDLMRRMWKNCQLSNILFSGASFFGRPEVSPFLDAYEEVSIHGGEICKMRFLPSLP